MKEYIVRCEPNKMTYDREIVRCKDCKWFDPKRANFVDGYGYCELYEVTDKDSRYCSYGEKQVTGKLEYVEKATSEGKESTMGQPKSKLESDLISRQAAIEEIKNATTITWWNKYASQEEIVDDVERQLRRLFVGAIESLPPVEPPKKVVAQIKVDTDEIVERIKEEYEIKDLPVCEDAISRADAIKAVEAKIKWFDGDAIEDRYKRYAFIQVLDEILTELPQVEPERPKGKWIPDTNGYWKCSECGLRVLVYAKGNFCPNCGADMRGDKE